MDGHGKTTWKVPRSHWLVMPPSLCTMHSTFLVGGKTPLYLACQRELEEDRLTGSRLQVSTSYLKTFFELLVTTRHCHGNQQFGHKFRQLQGAVITTNHTSLQLQRDLGPRPSIVPQGEFHACARQHLVTSKVHGFPGLHY